MRRTALSRAGVLWAATVFAICGCSNHGNDCSDLGCIEEVVLELPDELADPGTYHVLARLDADEVACTISLPGEDDDSCSGSGLVFIGRGATDETSSLESESGSLSIGAVAIEGVYANVSLSIERDGMMVVSGSARPRYQDVEINGPGCGVCRMANGSLESD